MPSRVEKQRRCRRSRVRAESRACRAEEKKVEMEEAIFLGWGDGETGALLIF